MNTGRFHQFISAYFQHFVLNVYLRYCHESFWNLLSFSYRKNANYIFFLNQLVHIITSLSYYMIICDLIEHRITAIFCIGTCYSVKTTILNLRNMAVKCDSSTRGTKFQKHSTKYIACCVRQFIVPSQSAHFNFEYSFSIISTTFPKVSTTGRRIAVSMIPMF